jgi:hypothetical protein
MSKSNYSINNDINNNKYIYIYRGAPGQRWYIDSRTGDIVGKVGAGLPAGDEDSPGAGGLSTCHNTRKNRKSDGKTAKITFYSDGSLLSVTKNRLNPYAGNKRDWVRGKVTRFSKRSRTRLMRTLAKIDKKKQPLWMDLTYPDEFPVDHKVYKADLEKFIKRMRYRFSEFACIWKLEFQKRGAAHYHMFVWGLPGLGIRKIVAKLWYEVVGSGDEKHLSAGTSVSKIRSWRGVMSYASKYMGKLETNEQGHPGRFWGVSGRGCIPWSAIEEYSVFPERVVMAMRMMRRYAGIKSRDYGSLNIYVDDIQQWKRALLC